MQKGNFDPSSYAISNRANRYIDFSDTLDMLVPDESTENTICLFCVFLVFLIAFNVIHHLFLVQGHIWLHGFQVLIKAINKNSLAP